MTSRECGDTISTDAAAETLIGLLKGGAIVLVTSRTCLSQRCTLFDEDEERTSHFLIVSRIWKVGGDGGREDACDAGTHRNGQLLIELLDPACSLDDDVKQGSHVLEKGPLPNPAMVAGAGDMRRDRQGSSGGGDRSKTGTLPTQRASKRADGCRALSLVQGAWRAEAGRYIVDWRVFDLVVSLKVHTGPTAFMWLLQGRWRGSQRHPPPPPNRYLVAMAPADTRSMMTSPVVMRSGTVSLMVNIGGYWHCNPHPNCVSCRAAAKESAAWMAPPYLLAAPSMQHPRK